MYVPTKLFNESSYLHSYLSFVEKNHSDDYSILILLGSKNASLSLFKFIGLNFHKIWSIVTNLEYGAKVLSTTLFFE